MRLRTRYRLAGLAWAALLGPAAGLGLAGAGAGLAWLYIFGDDPWPQGALDVVGAIAVAGGLLTATLCLWLASRYGKSRETATLDRVRERRRVAILTAVPLLVLLLAGAGALDRSRRHAEEMDEATRREAAYAELLGARHRITEVTVRDSGGGTMRAAILVEGERPGAYALRWQVAGTSFGTPLLAGEHRLDLQPGRGALEVEFTLPELAASYRETILEGRGGVLVEEPFHLQAVLEPKLTAAELAELPPGERHSLERGESPLQSRLVSDFPVRFMIRRDGTIVL